MPHTPNAQPGARVIGTADPANSSDVGVNVDADVSVMLGPTGPRPCMITPPRPVVLVVVGPLKAMVLVPMTRPDGPSEIGVPEMVMAGPFTERVDPAMVKAVGLAVNGVPATVKIDCKDGDVRGIVLLPMIRAEGPSETGVPAIVTAGPPLERDVPAIEKPVGFTVNVFPATVKMDWMGVDCSGSGMVLLPMTSAVTSRDIGVPDTVIGEPPGVSVVAPTIIAPVGPMETV